MLSALRRIEMKYGRTWDTDAEEWTVPDIVKLARALVESLNHATFAARKTHVERTLKEVAGE